MVDEQESSRSSTKFTRRICLTLAFSSLSASVAISLIVIFSLHGNKSYLERILGIFATLLFFLGVSIFTAYSRRRQNSRSEAVPQVAVSLVPEEDLEKSPAPILPYNHIPRHQPFAMKASSQDLPGYTTVVKNIDEVYSSVDAKVWTEDIPDIPPPCYEEALKMKTLPATVNVTDTHFSQRGNTEGLGTRV